MVDAGAGIVRRAALAARTDSIPALDPSRLGRVFVTHLHSDHTLGMPDLILTPWVLGRTTPLDVYGPPGTARMLDLLEQAYSADIAIRLRAASRRIRRATRRRRTMSAPELCIEIAR
jgi:ribonuclease BN (tRNA processing enzyme)